MLAQSARGGNRKRRIASAVGATPTHRHFERSRPIFFLRFRSRVNVGLRREKSLFSLCVCRADRSSPSTPLPDGATNMLWSPGMQTSKKPPGLPRFPWKPRRSSHSPLWGRAAFYPGPVGGSLARALPLLPIRISTRVRRTEVDEFLSHVGSRIKPHLDCLRRVAPPLAKLTWGII